MSGKADHLMPFVGSFQERSGVGADLTETWGTLTTCRYREEEYGAVTNKWARRQGNDYTEFAINKELDRRKTYRFWEQGDDTSDESLARHPELIRPVYDRDGVFAYTVLGF